MPDQPQGQEPNASGQAPHQVEQAPDASGQAPPPQQESVPADSAASPTPDAERFDAEYVRRLRAEAAEYRKRMRELEQQVKQHEEAKLSESERLQKRLSELEREREAWMRERQERTLKYETMLTASRLGIVDPEAAYRLLDLAKLDFDDDGAPKNLDQALKDLLKAKPYLAGQPPLTVAPTNPVSAPRPRGGTFTTTQIADRRFWEQHREEILAAMREGRIIEG